VSQGGRERGSPRSHAMCVCVHACSNRMCTLRPGGGVPRQGMRVCLPNELHPPTLALSHGQCVHTRAHALTAVHTQPHVRTHSHMRAHTVTRLCTRAGPGSGSDPGPGSGAGPGAGAPASRGAAPGDRSGRGTLAHARALNATLRARTQCVHACVHARSAHVCPGCRGGTGRGAQARAGTHPHTQVVCSLAGSQTRSQTRKRTQ
jgi:hypothetical protein